MPHKLVDAETLDFDAHQFAAALSFPEIHDGFVRQVAAILVKQLGSNAVFYYKNFIAYLAGDDLDIKLQTLYRDRAKLVCVFLGGDYIKGQWCGVEWRGIRDAIKQRKGDRMYFRFDDREVPGLPSIAGYIDCRMHNPAAIAALILKRLGSSGAAIACPPSEAPSEPSSNHRSTAISTSQGSASVEIVINREFGDFNEEEQRRLLEALRQVLHLGGVTVTSRRPGSVILKLSLSVEDAETLRSAITSGALEHLGIVDIGPVENSPPSESNEGHNVRYSGMLDPGEPMRLEGMNWFVLRVATNKEFSVQRALLRKVKIRGLDHLVNRVLVPIEKSKKVKGGKIKIIEAKCFPGYVFVELRLEPDGRVPRDLRLLMNEIPAVGDFVGSPGRLTALKEHEIEKMLVASGQPEHGSEVGLGFAKGEHVVIKSGPFQDYEGTVEEVNQDKGLVRVLVTIFGRRAAIEFTESQIGKADRS